MNEKLYDFLMELPKRNLINLMWEALDHMQAYNGRSRTACICMAMDCEEIEKDNGRVTFKPPSIKQVKENTKYMGL